MGHHDRGGARRPVRRGLRSPSCALSVLRITVAAFDAHTTDDAPHAASATGATDRLYGVIVDVQLSDPDPTGDSSSATGAFADLTEFPQPFPAMRPGIGEPPRFEPLMATSRRATFLLAPPPALFLDANASLGGTYRVHLGVARPADAPFPCVGVTLFRARLTVDRRDAEPLRAFHNFAYEPVGACRRARRLHAVRRGSHSHGDLHAAGRLDARPRRRARGSHRRSVQATPSCSSRATTARSRFGRRPGGGIGRMRRSGRTPPERAGRSRYPGAPSAEGSVSAADGEESVVERTDLCCCPRKPRHREKAIRCTST